MIQWIDALEFADYGGFVEETQFVQEMGQAYLLACGTPGVPVRKASVGFNTEKDGICRVWIRTKNWYPKDSPGRLTLLADGISLHGTVGTLPCERWNWEIAGDVCLKAGSHTLEIEDLTGYFGRFSAIIITDETDYTPEERMDRMLEERAKIRGESTEPIDMGDFGVVVAGGGPAGVPAAIAAARKGVKTVLIHARPGLGGNASEEGAIGFDGAQAKHPYARETGIAEEIRRIKEYRKISWEAAMKELADAEEALSVRYNQFVFDAEEENGIIRSVIAIDCRTGKRYRYRAFMFIDCTGDGWLGYYAGAKYRLGREAKWEYGEEFAPDYADNHTMSGCLTGTYRGKQMLGFYAEESEKKEEYHAPGFAVRLPEGKALARVPQRYHTGEWWVENPADRDDLWEQEKIRDELFRLNLGYFHWLKNSFWRKEKTERLKLAALGRYLAKRETRRLIGDYVMSQNDCCGKAFDDAVAFCGWTIDVHNSKGIYSGKEGPYYTDVGVPITGIPFRCLYSKNRDNLLMAGRCMSVTHLALGTVRVEGTLAMTGQAVGTAAAWCVERQITPRELYQKYISEFVQELLKDDCSIPGRTNEDPKDLARQASVTADSASKSEYFSLKRGVCGKFWELDKLYVMTRFACRMDSGLCGSQDGGRAGNRGVRVYGKNESGHAANIRAGTFALDHPGIPNGIVRLDETEARLEDGFEGWISLSLKTDTDKSGIGLYLKPADGIFIREILGATGHEWGGCGTNLYDLELTPLSSFETQWWDETFEAANCMPDNVINGVSRIRSKEVYEWVSDPGQELPQSIVLSFDEEREISEVRIVFDTDLMNPVYSYLELPQPAKCVRDYRVEGCRAGIWSVLAQKKDNFMRLAVHSFDKRILEQIRITVERTWGDPSARILEVRIY